MLSNSMTKLHNIYKDYIMFIVLSDDFKDPVSQHGKTLR